MNEYKEKFKKNGYVVINLIDERIYTIDEILEMREICMSSYYSYFTDRGMNLEEIVIDLDNNMTNNQYFKQPKDSKMFKAMYGQVSKAGKEYINTRVPANAMSCGMGTATSQPSIYYNERFNELKEKMRPLMTELYGSPVKKHLSRFGLKLPVSKDMALHTDMSYLEKYKDNFPDMKSPDDPVAYHTYDKNGVYQRLQCIIGLNESDGGWYGYPEAHNMYSEIGEQLGWPGKTKTLQKIPKKAMKVLGLTRVDVPTKIGETVIWSCGIPHGNSACKKRPRLVAYVNYQPDNEQTTADCIIGLGNQPVDVKKIIN